ncbi:lipoprotein-releasing ABC transporter permease subunit [Hahella ganghwensis]|uniref:lipoprotein-releasing ABC transporter permease subunit n=1 Tax=Hahella ganghwensis TaxID=286420 RepID=UPI00036A682D|nr:lipoprotein-releasing ABC transporter permease subunit [Hahella ganghwensis]
MYKPLSLFIGLRYTAAKRDNHFISFISLTSMIGLILGVLVLITVMSVMNGFDRELRQRILGMVPHAVVKSYSPMTNWQELKCRIGETPGVEGVAPFIQAQGMATAEGNVHGILMNGIDPVAEQDVSIVQNHMMQGSLTDLKPGEFGIIVGDLLARSLRARVGDKVTVILPEASITPAGVFPRMKRLTVVGIFSVGAELDGTLAMIHIDDAAKLKRLGNSIEGLRLRMENLFASQKVAWGIASELGSGYYASDWTRTHGNLFQAIRMEKTMVGLLLMFIIAVAAFNIVSTLVMVVTDKKADIAILRTMGATPGEILKIFMVQGTFIGVIGTGIGVLLGVLLATNISGMIAGIEDMLGTQFLSSDVYFISYLPSELQWADVGIISACTLSISFLATIYPAYRASKIEPAEALRYE